METPQVQNLGWANGWTGTPRIVLQCRAAGHKRQSRNLDLTHHGRDTEYRCDICGYVYHVDSSD